MTLKEYWLNETIIGSNTLDGAAMYIFGNYPDQQGTGLMDLTTANQINEIEKIGQNYREYTVGNQPLDNLTTKYIPVNGLPAKWSLGAVTNDGNGLHTISNFTTSRKPRISVWRQGDSTKDKDYGKGCVAGSTTWSFQLGSPLMVDQSFKGMSNGRTTDTPASATYPSSISSPFQVYNYWKWNDVEYKIEGFRKQEIQELTPFMGPLGFYGDINEFHAIEAIWTVIFAENVDLSNIMDDQYILTSAGVNGGTARTIDAKILKADDNTKYIRFYNSSAICIDLRKTIVVGQPTRYEGTFLGGSSTTYVVDGVADAFY